MVNTWCYSCRIGNKTTLILHTYGCPPELVAWENSPLLEEEE